MRISNDSTCSSIRPSSKKTSKSSLFLSNSSSKNLFQMQILKNDFNHKKTVENSSVDFPDWMQGDWEYLKIKQNSLQFKDHSSYKIYSMILVSQFNNEKFVVLSRTQCGEEYFRCIWIRKLHHNVLDFQIGSDAADTLDAYDFCNNEYFDDNRWLTQSSKEIHQS